MSSGGMKLPASFGRKVEPEKSDDALVMPESFADTLLQTRRRVLTLMILSRLLLGFVLLLLFLKYGARKNDMQHEDPILLTSQLNVCFVLALSSIGMARYARSLREFLDSRSNSGLLALLESYRAMWIKLGISLLMLLTVAGISAIRTLMFPLGV